MSKPKYDVRRITQEAFDKWLEGEAWANGGFRSSLEKQLMDAARVPESPTSAELEEQLVEHLVRENIRSDCGMVWRKTLLDKVDEIREARAREAKEHDDE